MILKQLSLQNFRNYPKSTFDFSPATTLVVGPNTAGKSNLLEAILLLSTGKSNKADKEMEAIRFGEEMARIGGKVESGSRNQESGDKFELEVIITTGQVQNIETPQKKYLVNNIAKRRADFAGNLSAVSFAPSDLELIIGSPSLRREFFDDTLEAVDSKYRKALADYIKALRQRNALLDLVKETGRRNDKQFEYWDEIVIENGQYITKAREEFIAFLNKAKKDIFECVVFYDHSKISIERLDQYKKAEEGGGGNTCWPASGRLLCRVL